jgi:hypothetical protein
MLYTIMHVLLVIATVMVLFSFLSARRHLR